MATAKHKEKNIKQDTGEPFYKRHFIPIVIFCFSFLLYANTINNDYNLDDELVTRNHKLTSKGFSAIPEIFTSPYYSDDMGYSYDYRPIVHLSFAIEHQFFGESAHVSHFFNVLLFAALCVLLYLLLKALLPVPDVLLVAAMALFAAHPIHTEVVASIKNRDELLMFLFSALSLYVILRWLDSNFLLATGLGFVCFALALLSKSTAIPFAFLIPFSVVFFRKLSFGKYFLLSFALSFLAALLINNTQLLFKLRIGVLLLVGSTAVYLLLLIIRQGFKMPTLDSLKANLVSSQAAESHSAQITISAMLPTGMHMAILLGVYIAILLGVYGLFANAEWLVYTSVAACVLYIVFSPHRSNLWAILPLFVFLLLLVEKYDVKWKLISLSSVIGISVLINYADKKARYFFILLLLLLSVHWALNLRDGYYFAALLFVGTLFATKLKQKLLTGALVAACAILIIIAGLQVYKGRFNLTSTLCFTFVIAYLWAIYKGYKAKPVFISLLVILTASIVFASQVHVIHSTKKFNAFSTSENSNSDYGLNASINRLQQVNVQGPVSVSTDRPLNFIETPVPLASPIKDKALLALDVFMRYIKLLAIPHPLLFYYGYKVIEPVTSFTPLVIISILFHALLLGIGIVCIKKQPVVAWCIFFYLAFMLTLGNIFISIPGVMGERYLLVPSLAYCVLIAWLIVKAAEYLAAKQNSDIKQMVKWIAIPILAVYGCMTVYRNSLWKDDITLFSHDLEYAHNSAQAHNLLAIHLMQKSFKVADANEQTEMRKKALYHFKETSRIYPPMFNAAYDIGRAYTTLNMPDSAIAAFKYASTLDTNFYNIQLSIAEIYYAQARYDEAVPYLHYLIRKLPNYYPTYEMLSYILFLKKQYKESVDVNRLAIKNMPNTPEPYINIVRTFVGENKIDSARHYALQAYRIAPQNSMAQQMVRELGVAPQ